MPDRFGDVVRGLALRHAGRAVAVVAVAVVAVQSAAATITHLWIVLNPVKPRGRHR
jgi:hypothetical protein